MIYRHSVLQRAINLASFSEANRPIVLPSTVTHHFLGAYLAAWHIHQPLVSRISLHISLNGRRSRHAFIPRIVSKWSMGMTYLVSNKRGWLTTWRRPS